MKNQKKTTAYQICVMGLMAAVMCVLGPMSIPIGAVPFSFTIMVVYLAVYLLGMKMGTMSYIVYLLLGLVGLPVFSGYTGGVAKLAGPTGGYLIGMILMALICGLFMEKSSYKLLWSGIGIVLGTVVAYIFGTFWFMKLMDCTFMYAFTICVQPFLIGDAVKMVVALYVGREVRKRLGVAGLLASSEKAASHG